MTHQGSISLFELLSKRVEALETIAASQVEAENTDTAESVFRACILLAVSSLDAFVHEKSVEIYLERAANNHTALPEIAKYLKVPTDDLRTSSAESMIRYKLSFKTLVLPEKIDEAIDASGTNSKDVWKEIGVGTGARETRLRNSLTLQVDRRNQIAHEGDWDFIDLSLRHISVSHSRDCRKCIDAVFKGLRDCWS